MGLGASVRKVSMSNFYCQECGSKITLPRKRNVQKSKGHIKHLYCIRCKEVKPHIEIRECDFDMAR